MEVLKESRVPVVGHSEALGEAATNPPSPRTNGFEVSTEKRVYTFSPLEQRIKAQFEKFVRRSALSSIQSVEEIDPMEADKQRSVYQGDFAAGEYNWGREKILRVLNSVDGFDHLTLLCLQRCDPKVTTEDVVYLRTTYPKDLALAMRWALGNSGTLTESPG